MDLFFKLESRYIPLHTVLHIDDDGEQVVIAIRDARSGPEEFRLYGEEADRLRNWLDQHTAVALTSATQPQDTGYRDDD